MYHRREVEVRKGGKVVARYPIELASLDDPNTPPADAKFEAMAIENAREDGLIKDGDADVSAEVVDYLGGHNAYQDGV